LESSAYLRRADGDVELKQVDFSKFNVPSCNHCNVGILKPGLKLHKNKTKTRNNKPETK